MISKDKLYKWSSKYITPDNIKIAILSIPLLILLIKDCVSGEFSFRNFFDISILLSFILIFTCEILATHFAGFIKKRCEDAAKLTENYGQLTDKYCRENMIQYCGHTYPGILLAFRAINDTPFEYDIDNSLKNATYRLPKQIADNSLQLMKAHEYSKVYNSMTVRINDCSQYGNKIKLLYSRTTYYDSLISNRAMDFQLTSGKTIREIYEPGPFLSTLLESKLSNHLGFNGFVELEGGKIIFIHRASNVSVAKNTLAPSVNAAYKVKYGLNSDHELSSKSIGNAIREEIRDELKIHIDDSVPLENSIFAFYRDLVEGGKPHFVFYYRLPTLSIEDFKLNFRRTLTSKDKKNLIVDSTGFEFFTIEQLKHSLLSSSKFEVNNIKYEIRPFTSISTALLIQHLTKGNSD